MIAKILYRDGVEGMLNYVLQNKTAQVLGFHNFMGTDTGDMERFKNTLQFQGYRHNSEKKFGHFMLNLPPGERLSSKKFNEMARLYMTGMGYGDQPYVVVEHNDKKHQHVHIVTTTITEGNTLIDTSHDFSKSQVLQRKLEEAFKLSKSPEFKKGSLRPSNTENISAKDIVSLDSNGVRFFLQDNIHRVLKKYRPRNETQLKSLLRPLGISFQIIDTKKGKGAIFGIDGHEERYRVIYGSRIHKTFSAPKLEALFHKNNLEKSLVRKRMIINKQVRTVAEMYTTISPDALEIIMKLQHRTETFVNKTDLSDIIYSDRKGFLISNGQLSAKTVAELQGKLKGAPPVLDITSKPFLLLINRLAIDALNKSYTHTENVDKKKLAAQASQMVKSLRDNQLYDTLYSHVHKDQRKQFIEIVKQTTLSQLNNTISDYRDRLQKQHIEKSHIIDQLFQQKRISDSLSLRTVRNTFGIAADKSITPYFPGHVHSHYQTWKTITNNRTDTPKSDIVLYLPMFMPEFYTSAKNLENDFYPLALKNYLVSNVNSLSTATDNGNTIIDVLHARGFHLSRENKSARICIESIYSGATRTPLDNDTVQKLLPDITLEKIPLKPLKHHLNQKQIASRLDSLWTTHLIDRGLYEKAAFRMKTMNVKPLLTDAEYRMHLGKGLEQALERSGNYQNLRGKRFLSERTLHVGTRKGVKGVTEAYNSFRDELTDYEALQRQSRSIDLT